MRDVVIGDGVVERTDALEEGAEDGFGLGRPGVVLEDDGEQVLFGLIREGQVFGAEEGKVKMGGGLGNLRKLFLHYLF